ncbi:BRCT domain-containing protein [Acinetobacter towneri]|uniref:BRCT domain-containing protein n=1 Tax=Acinetobacter towneri TaxID=202956 RepID=UPI003A8AD059
MKLNNTILGFFEGIFIDDEINEIEVKGLMRWIEVYPEFCELSNFDSLYQILTKAISDQTFLENNHSEVNQILKTFKRSKYFTTGTADIQRLHGVLSGLLCDGNITAGEVLALQQWLDAHKHLKEENLYEEIYSLLSTVRALNRVDPAVIEALIANISKYVDRDNYCLPKVSLTSSPEQRNPNFYHGDFDIVGTLFCLTGASNRYTKAEWKENIEAKGGLFTDSLTKKVDYLVICNKGNPSWAHMSYGRKFEQALKWQNDGDDIRILTEDDFVKVLEG